MAQQTNAGIPSFGQTFEAAQSQVRPDLQTGLAGFIASRKFQAEKQQNELANKLAQAKALLEQQTAQSEAAKRQQDITASQNSFVPSTSILDPQLREGIEQGQGTRQIPASLVGSIQRPQTGMNDIFKSLGTTKTGLPVSQLRQGGQFVITDTTGKQIPFDRNIHGEIQPEVSPTLPAPIVERVVNGINSLKQLENAKDTFDKSFTGPVESRVQRLSQFSGVDFSKMLTGVSAFSPQAAEFKTAMANMVNSYIKATTGAQMSEHEVPRLMAAIPNSGNADEIFLASVDAAIKIRKDMLQTDFDAAKAVGYRNSESVEKLLSKFDKKPGVQSDGTNGIAAQARAELERRKAARRE